MNRSIQDAGQTSRSLLQLVGPLDSEVEASRKQFGQPRIAAHGDQSIRRAFKVTPLKRTTQLDCNGFIVDGTLSFGLDLLYFA